MLWRVPWRLLSDLEWSIQIFLPGILATNWQIRLSIRTWRSWNVLLWTHIFSSSLIRLSSTRYLTRTLSCIYWTTKRNQRPRIFMTWDWVIGPQTSGISLRHSNQGFGISREHSGIHDGRSKGKRESQCRVFTPSLVKRPFNGYPSCLSFSSFLWQCGTENRAGMMSSSFRVGEGIFSIRIWAFHKVCPAKTFSIPPSAESKSVHEIEKGKNAIAIYIAMSTNFRQRQSSRKYNARAKWG